ncbi:monooxygenase family protein [Limibacterium fermenti]|jgi:heme oxygenase (staphylobilin-producing)|uniref:monooxygenase family protein n=1 Tax=Limibacterium fermenti TaxID=3229863 RepID=UPI000E938343|nr:hypothetical protein [Porphyromonadaceae bacterium]HCM20947.1 hypothetical protein [Porphyromonadaceae bacterium]
MYIVYRDIKAEKDVSNLVIDMFSEPSLMESANGFIRTEILLDKSDRYFDKIKVVSYWENKESLKKWQTSKAHLEMHKSFRNTKYSSLDFTSIEQTFEEYELFKVINYIHP